MILQYFKKKENEYKIKSDKIYLKILRQSKSLMNKKYFNLINSEKDASRTRAIEIFPYFSSELSRKKDSNKADAILIARFYHETYKMDD